MGFDETLGTVMQWVKATEAMAALGADLSLRQSGTTADPQIVAALQKVSTAAGLSDLEQLAPPQRAMLAAWIRMYIHQAYDLIENPGRPPGWAFTDPAILDGWGRGSMAVPPVIAAAHPDLASITSFLDVGTGVGLLAVAAAGVWPDATIVGIDPWEPSLVRARTNVSDAGLGERITLRQEALAEITDVDTYDCVWIPSFFVNESDLEKGLTATLPALRAGGWVAIGRLEPPPDPLAEAVGALRNVRGGGTNLDSKRGVEILEAAGFTNVHVAAPTGPSPLSLVLGQRPA